MTPRRRSTPFLSSAYPPPDLVASLTAALSLSGLLSRATLHRVAVFIKATFSMVKSKKSKSGVSKTVRRFTVVEDRPGSSASTRVHSTLVRQKDLLREREESLRMQRLAFSGMFSGPLTSTPLTSLRAGLSGRAVEHRFASCMCSIPLWETG